MESLKPDGAIDNMGVNYFPLQSEKVQSGYIRPNNFAKTREKMITFLGGKGQNQVARSIRADKYLTPSFPTAPIKTKAIKSEVVPEKKGTCVDEDEMNERATAAYQTLKDRYQAQVKIWANETKSLDDGKYYAVEVALAQCTTSMREALKICDNYDTTIDEGDILALLKLIQTCSLSNKGRGYQVKNSVMDLKRVLSCY